MKNYIFILLGILYFWMYFAVVEFGILSEFFLMIKAMLFNGYFEYIISWLNAVFAYILIFYSLWILKNALHSYYKKVFSKARFEYKDLVWDLIFWFLQIAKFIIAFYAALQVLILPEKIQIFVDHLFRVSFVFALLIWVTSLINSVFKQLQKQQEKSSMSKQVFPILNKCIVVFVWIVGIIMILSNLWYNVSALITWAWVGWLAVALAAQKTVANVFGAVSVILNKPFKIGDFIGIGNYTGTVKDIWLTYLKLIGTNGNEILIPNETIISSSIENLTLRENRRVDFVIGVTYNTTLEKLKQWVSIIENILDPYKWEEDEKPLESYRVHFDMFWDFSLNINATYFSKVEWLAEHNKLKEEINFKIKEQFEQHQIDIAFPTQTIILEK